MEKNINEKRRKIPRHVDGRIKIFGVLPLKNFFIILPINIIFVIIFINLLSNYKTPYVIFSLLPIGFVSVLFCEFRFGISGYNIIKDFIKFSLRGAIYTERKCSKNE